MIILWKESLHLFSIVSFCKCTNCQTPIIPIGKKVQFLNLFLLRPKGQLFVKTLPLRRFCSRTEASNPKRNSSQISIDKYTIHCLKTVKSFNVNQPFYRYFLYHLKTKNTTSINHNMSTNINYHAQNFTWTVNKSWPEKGRICNPNIASLHSTFPPCFCGPVWSFHMFQTFHRNKKIRGSPRKTV